MKKIIDNSTLESRKYPFFCSDIYLSEKAKLTEILYIYSAKKNHRDDPAKNRYIFKIVISRFETEYNSFMEISLCEIYNQHSAFSTPTCENKLTNHISRYSNTFTCTVCKQTHSVKFGPHYNLGMVSDEFKGRGLGSFCMSYLVTWLCDIGCKDYSVESLWLSSQDALTEVDRDLRNHFYTRMGFKLSNMTDDMKDGRAIVDSVLNLSTKFNKRKVLIVTQEKMLDLLSNKNNKIIEQKKQLKGHKGRIETLEFINTELRTMDSVLKMLLALILCIWIAVSVDDNILKVTSIVLIAAVSILLYGYDVKNWFLKKYSKIMNYFLAIR